MFSGVTGRGSEVRPTHVQYDVIADASEATVPKWEDVCGVEVANVDLESAVEILQASIHGKAEPLSVMCANAHAFVVLQEDDILRKALATAGLVLPDGVGVALASALAGGEIRNKVGGPDVFEALTKRANDDGGVRYFFMGTTSQTLQRIQQRMEAEYPKVTIAGAYAPPMGDFSEAENNRMVTAINRALPHVLWVGLSAPKQEKWIYLNRNRLKVPVVAAVGAAVDFFCGNKKRPRWAVRHGLFWLYRLVTEPRRLGARYLLGTPRFLYLATREGLRCRSRTFAARSRSD